MAHVRGGGVLREWGALRSRGVGVRSTASKQGFNTEYTEKALRRDPRVLGVAIRRMAVRQGARFQVLEAADPALAEGFHEFEPRNGFRWTDGNSELPAALFEGFDGPMELVLHVGGTTHYL